MKRLTDLVLLMCAAWLLLGCTDGKRYAQILDRAQEQNQNYETITDIDSIQMAADYMDKHGNSNNKVRGYYLLGCAYRDAGEASNAIEAFHEAADRTDTTRADCDYGLLMRVHSQSAELFKAQLLPYEMLEELEAQRRCAIKAGNMRAAINAIERRADAYNLLNKPDSVISLRMQASTMYEQCGYTEEAAQTLSPCIEPLVDRGDTAEARRCIERYETSKNFFHDGEILPRKLVHYYSKGKYYLAVGKTDSAEACFRKLIKPGLDPQQLEAGYRGMFLTFREKNKLDSVAKYADLLFLEAIPVVEAVNNQNIQQMQGLYNYSRLQREAKETAEKSDHLKGMILILVVAVIALSLVALGIAKLLGIVLKRPLNQFINPQVKMEQPHFDGSLYEIKKNKNVNLGNSQHGEEE